MVAALGALGCPGSALRAVARYFGWPGPEPRERDARGEAWFGG